MKKFSVWLLVVAICGFFIGATTVTSAQERSLPSTAPDPAEVEEAIIASREYLLHNLRVGDHWESNISMGEDGIWDLIFTIYYALTLEHLDTDDASQQQAIDYVLSRRDPDGGWDDTVANYGGLLLLRSVDEGRYREIIADVEREIEEKEMSLTRETVPNVMDPLFQLKLFYAVMSDGYSNEELFPNDECALAPQLLLLTPAFEEGIDPEKSLVYPYVIDPLLSSVILCMTMEEELATAEADLLQAATELLLAHRLSDGTWESAGANVFAVLALHEAGYTAAEPEIRYALDWLGAARLTESGRFVVFNLPVWDTGWAIISLHEAGVDLTHSKLKEAAQWLLDARNMDLALTPLPLKLARPPLPFSEHWGRGWGFRPYMFSDWDDTALAITTLSLYGDTLVHDDVTFLFEVQRSDGSWEAFVADDYQPLDETEKEMVMTVDETLYELLFLAYPAPDVTGHALEALGTQGYSIANEDVRRGVDFLLDNRAPNGMWKGVWAEAFTYGTSQVLIGLRELGFDMARPAIQEAVAALLAQQNADGGWGERSTLDYDDLVYHSAKSTPEQTAWVIAGLLAADVSPDHEAVREAVTYLVETQRADGSWEPQRVMYNYAIPPMYSDPAFTQASALRALALYARAEKISVRPEPNLLFGAVHVPPQLGAGVIVILLVAGAFIFYRRQRQA